MAPFGRARGVTTIRPTEPKSVTISLAPPICGLWRRFLQAPSARFTSEHRCGPFVVQLSGTRSCTPSNISLFPLLDEHHLGAKYFALCLGEDFLHRSKPKTTASKRTRTTSYSAPYLLIEHHAKNLESGQLDIQVISYW